MTDAQATENKNSSAEISLEDARRASRLVCLFATKRYSIANDILKGVAVLPTDEYYAARGEVHAANKFLRQASDLRDATYEISTSQQA